jgi:tetratricopeptide (TPR) repeat protein
VAKKHKHPTPVRLSPADLAARVRRAEGEGRFQQALELAKSLYKQEPSPPHRELVQRMTLGRAHQLRTQGYTRDAHSVLENAVALDSQQTWREQLAEEMAACGQVWRALELLRPFADSPALPRVLVQAADAALGQGKAGKGQLPENLHGQFDLILQAFDHAEAGRDEEARAALQGIGLQSPFLEWKVLLRGLIAYYQGDDERALENWQRLCSDRLPARLAAPLRFAIDRAFRTAQPPATQAALQQQADRLQSSGLVQSLRAVQADLANEHKLPQAFRAAEALLPALRQQAPQLVGRLASCFYWAVVHSGRPEDVPRYQRVFGAPADDPAFARLHALAFEHRMQMADAHQAWQEFEQEVARPPAAWPGGQAERVRALVWHHMGQNAAGIPDDKEMARLPHFLRDHPDCPRPLNPGAEKCFEKSLKLAPDQLETHEELFKVLQRKKKTAAALKAGRRLLERFPDHVPTLEAIGDLLLGQHDYTEGLRLLQQALRANPLERRLRKKVGYAHQLKGRDHTTAGHFDEARAEYQAALALEEGKKSPMILCNWAALEFKAGNAERAEELIGKARADDAERAAVALKLVIEAVRVKLPRPLKSRFDKDFKDALAEPPTAARAVALAEIASAHHAGGITYLGQKTHDKQVVKYLEMTSREDFTEQQLLVIGQDLGILGSRRAESRFLKLGQRKFPHSPIFFLAEAERNIAQGPGRCPIYPTQMLLERARDLANALPNDERRKDLLDRINKGLDVVRTLNPFSRLMDMDLLDDVFNPSYDDDDYDDEFDSSW